MENILERVLTNHPDAARGKDPLSTIGFIGDPDMGSLNHTEAGQFSKLWGDCRPKFTKNPGTIVIFGTAGEI